MKKDLNNGLVLRSLANSSPEEIKAAGEFYVRVFSEAEPNSDDPATFDLWMEDLFERNPQTTPDDFWIVVDPAADDKIVSALLLIPQTWHYAGIELGVGRVELVATDKDYRRRGLVRDLMTVAHERSTDLGHVMQSITGIPYFYRQFGYTMAVDTMGARGIMPFSSVKALKDNTKPDFTLRPATLDDIPALIACDEFVAPQYLMTVKRDAALWQYELTGRDETPHYPAATILMIVNQADEAVGYVMFSNQKPSGDYLYVSSVVIGEKSSVLATFKDVVRGLKQYTIDVYPDKAIHGLAFNSGNHPAIEALTVHQRTQPPYTWYLRIGDMVGFMTTIAPVLEKRLENSGAHRYSGTLTIDFYQHDKLVLTFKDGAFVGAEYGKSDNNEDAAFPFELFLNIIFGQHSPQDVRALHADAWCSPKAQVLLETLFPVQRSSLNPIA